MKFLDRIKNVEHKEKKVFEKIAKDSIRVMLFGAGAVSVFTYGYVKKNGITPVCFCDNSVEKQGKMCLGLPVLSYADFKNMYPYNYCIIISTANMKSIYNDLIEKGEDPKNIVYMGDFRDPWSENTDYSFIEANEDKFEKVYNSLADEISKEVYINVLNCKISGDTSLIDSVRSHDQYFEEGIVDIKSDEIFVDVGAYSGDTIGSLLEHAPKGYKKIVALEPDSENYVLVKKYIEKNNIDNVELIQKGAWHKHEILHFADGLTGSSSVLKEGFETEKIVEIEVDSIDAILNGGRASFIKMDIEGAERNAIIGAEYTIKKYRPKLAISIYHKREDMFDIPLLIRSYVSDYKFYVRNYSDTAADTVLYAIA